MIHFLFQVFCYLCIGALCLILFVRRWPETYLVELEDSKDVLITDVDSVRRFWALILWPIVLVFYICTRIYDFFTWIFNLSVKSFKQKLQTEEHRALVEEELRVLVQSRAKAEEEILTNKLQ